MDLQRIQIKFLTEAPPALNLEPFVAIFGRWRADKKHPADWVDLADYAHLPGAGSILLAGKNANFAFDMSPPAPGVLYMARKGLNGTPAERIALTLRASFEMCRRLMTEPDFPKDVRLQIGAMELSFPDRLETPNTPATDQALRPPIEQILHRILGESGYELTWRSDPRLAYGVSVRSKIKEPLENMLQRLG
jgi:hypothetical protein